MDARLSGDLQRALERIPERQRAALLLAELHDLTGLELAAALGVSHVAARALLTRARESLRQALAAEREADAAAEAADDAAEKRDAERRRDERPAHDCGAADHADRARELAALRVDGPIGPDDALARRAPRVVRPVPRRRRGLRRAAARAPRAARDEPVPPRDLWARTAAAIEMEPACRRPASRGRRTGFGVYASLTGR